MGEKNKAFFWACFVTGEIVTLFVFVLTDPASMMLSRCFGRQNSKLTDMLFYTTGNEFSAELVVYNEFLHLVTLNLLRKVLKPNQKRKLYTVHVCACKKEADWLSIMMFYPELNLIKNILSRKQP